MSLSLRLYLASARRAGRTKDSSTEKRLARPAGKLVWLHVSDQQDVPYVQGLIQQFTEDLTEASFLITTPDDITVTPPFQDNCDQPCLHIPPPADTPQAVDKFLEYWRPSVGIWLGSILRPSLLVGLQIRAVPLLMLNAQNRAQIIGQTRWSNGPIRACLAMFNHILASHETVKQQLVRQGADRQKIIIGGPMEETAPPLYCDDRDRDEMARILAARPIWLAGFTDESEDIAVVNAHRTAMRLSHRLLLILAPDNPDRGTDLAQTLSDDGWLVAQRSLNQDPDENTQIFIADTDDEMGLWLRLAPVCFMGNSLNRNNTGAMPGPASALGAAILYGPHVQNFKAQYSRLTTAGAARKVKNETELSSAVQELLAPDKAAKMAHAGWEITTSGAEAMERTMALIYNAINPNQPNQNEAP